MPLKNRVTPAGDIISIKEHGTFMGNRGCLHNATRQITKKSAHKAWITCLLNFQGIKRELMKPGAYTELFFLDSAVAYSAGHRPCNDCQKTKFDVFKNIWLESNEEFHDLPSLNMAAIDSVLHGERIGKQGDKITYTENADDLPDGTFIEHDNKYYLKWKNSYLEWSAAGYVAAITLQGNQQVKVLTPRSIVRCFKHGLVPEVHASASTL